MNQHNQERILYSEVQQFRQVWVWSIMVIAGGFCWYAVIKQVLFGVQVGNRPASDSMVMLIWVIGGIGMPLLFWSMKLITQVRSDGVYVRMAPIHRKFQVMRFADLQDYTVHIYHPLREFGGRGIRYGRSGKAYTVSGHLGVLFTFANGKQTLIGSQHPEELAHAIRQARSSDTA